MSHENVSRTQYVVSLENEVKALRSALRDLIDLYPYVNCGCGRNKLRFTGKKRERAIRLLNLSNDGLGRPGQ